MPYHTELADVGTPDLKELGTAYLQTTATTIGLCAENISL